MAQIRIRAPEQSQVLNYLKATGNRLGLLLNFGACVHRRNLRINSRAN